MMQDAGVLGPTRENSRTEPSHLAMQYGTQAKGHMMNKKRLDLMFCQMNSHQVNMSFETFLQTLIKIAEYKSPSSPSSDALQELVNLHLLPLHQ